MWNQSTRRLRRVPLGIRTALLAVSCLMIAGACSVQSEDPDSRAKTTTGATAAASQIALPDHIRKAGVLVLGTDPSYAPCEFVKPGESEIIGFEPDLWNAVGTALGVKVEVKSTQFAGLIPGVQSGRFDVAMECISDTAEREKTVSFVDYAYGAGGVVTLETNAAGITDDPLSLCGLRTAYQTGTVYADWVDDILNPNCTDNGKQKIQATALPGVGEIQLSLRSKRIDFILDDASAAAYETQESKVKLALFTPKILPRVYEGIVVDKQNIELQQALLEALQRVFDSGEYKQIMSHWNLGALALEAPGINLQESDPLPNAG
jgi:polar amino acid transport system substrate-binding protein